MAPRKWRSCEAATSGPGGPASAPPIRSSAATPRRLAGQRAQQRALAAAVGADQGQAVAAVQLQVDAVEDRLVAVGHAQAARGDRQPPVAEGGPGQVLEIEALGVLGALHALLAGHVALQAALLRLGLLRDLLRQPAEVVVLGPALGVQRVPLDRRDLPLERRDALHLVLVGRLVLLALAPL